MVSQTGSRGPLEDGPRALGSHCSEPSPQKGLLRGTGPFPLHQQDLKRVCETRLRCVGTRHLAWLWAGPVAFILSGLSGHMGC